jgi:hypothetical protein
MAGMSVLHLNSSQVTCECQLVNPACGLGSCVGTSYCEGNGCATPVCYASSSPVSQIMCGGEVAQPQIGMLPPMVVSDGDPVGAYNSADRGSNRGSGYAPTNTMLRHCDKLFATWQQYDPTTNRYTVFVGTNQLGTSTWSTPTALPAPSTITYPSGYSHTPSGNGMDNHGGASILADSNGYLHLLYGPHHAALLEAVSIQPWDASAFNTPTVVPTAPWYRTTYSSAVLDSAGTIHVLYRGRRFTSFDDWEMVYQRRFAGGVWDTPRSLVHTNIPGYALYDGTIAVGADDSLHVAYQMYSSGTPTASDTAPSWGYLRSTDHGGTWEDGINPGSLSLPVDTSTNIHFVESGNLNVRVGNIALDPSGNPWVSVTYLTTSSPATTQKPIDTKLWYRSNGTWSSPAQLHLSQYMPLVGSRASGATLTFDAQGVLYVAAEQVDPVSTNPDSWFDDPGKEVVLLVSSNLGVTFQVYPISQPDPLRARWLANLERPTTAVPIPVPALLYTDGSLNQTGTAADVVFVPFYKQ